VFVTHIFLVQIAFYFEFLVCLHNLYIFYVFNNIFIYIILHNTLYFVFFCFLNTKKNKQKKQHWRNTTKNSKCFVWC